jgi:hypothetical protein
MVGCTSQQKRQLSKWVESGFSHYAEILGDRKLVGALTDTPEQNRELIRSYGKEFVRVLEGKTDWGDDLPQLQADLFNLIERGCPVEDIIDLMFACTRGRSLALSDTLEVIGLSDPSLHLLRLTCHFISEKISALNMPQVPGPLFFLQQLLPELSDEDRNKFRADIQRLPELLAAFGDLLRIYPPEEAHNADMQAILREWELGFFYILLSHFNTGYPTLSRLLRTMRRVRYTVSPKERYLRRFGRVRVTMHNGRAPDEPAVRDPFAESALQKRLHRFFNKFGDWRVFMHFLMLQYFSQRTENATLLSALPKMMKPVG